MAEVSIGDAIGAGFDVIRRKPLAVLAWGLVEVVFLAVTLTVFGPIYLEAFSQVLTSAQNGVTAPTPDIARMMRMHSVNWLLSLGGSFVRVIVYCAVNRSVLHPQDSRFAYLRVGPAELFLFLLVIAAAIAFFAALFVPIIVLGIAIAALALAKAAAAAAVVGVIAFVALFAAIVYVALRFSLVGPMIVDDGRFHLFDAWALTRRHAGALLALGLCLVAILIVGQLVVALVMLLSGLGVLSAAAGGVDHIQTYFQQPPMTILAAIAPYLAIMGLVWIPLTGCAFAIFGAPWAKAYRDLSGPDLAATFS